MKRVGSGMSAALATLALVASLSLSAHAICGNEVHQAGISGGSGGNPFVSPAGRVTTVFVNSGEYVDGITLVFEGGYQEHFGGWGGQQHAMHLAPGATIVGIAGRCGQYVDSIQFFISNGQSSQVYGGNGGKIPYSYGVPNGCELVGLIGRCGQYVDAIGIQYQ